MNAILTLLLLLLFLCPPKAWAVPAFDASNDTFGESVTSLSFALSVSGSNRLLIGCTGTAETATITSFTYNAVALTLVADVNNADTRLLWLYRLIAPATGSNTLQVDYSAAVNFAALGAMSFTGAHQTTPLGAAGEDGNSGAENESIATVTSDASELVADCFIVRNDQAGNVTVGGSQTTRFEDVGFQFYGTTQAGAASVDMTYQWDGGATWHAHIAAPIKPAAVGKKRTQVNWID